MTQRDRFSALSRFAAHTSEPFYKHSCRSSYHRPITCGPCPRNGASSRCVTHHALFLLSAFIALCIPATRYIKTCIKTSRGRANNNDNELTGPICPRWRACCARLDGSHRQTDTVMEIDLFQLAGARYIYNSGGPRVNRFSWTDVHSFEKRWIDWIVTLSKLDERRWLIDVTSVSVLLMDATHGDVLIECSWNDRTIFLAVLG